jgi:hypothetical protein
MDISAKLVVSEVLMCGLKKLPLVGPAAEIVEAVKLRRELLSHEDRLAKLEGGSTRLDLRMREVVRDEIQSTLNGMCSPNLDGPTLTGHIRNLAEIQRHGWSPGLFEGLLRRSTHWGELKRVPSHYGTILRPIRSRSQQNSSLR